jgi:choice-of-anchor A domain-containing protein
VTVSPAQTLIVGGVTAIGKLRFAGSLTSAVDAVSPANVIEDPGAVSAYSTSAATLNALSICYGTAQATGTTTNQFGTFTLTGDATSALQVFNVNANIAGSGGSDVGIRFVNVPATSTVLVNMTGSSSEIHTFGDAGDGSFNALRERLLWNFPAASSVLLTGPAAFQGSILVGTPGSTATEEMPGMNGRFLSAGNICSYVAGWRGR